MIRPLVVEGRTLSVVTDGVNALGEIKKTAAVPGCRRRLPSRVVGRCRRVLRKGVKQIRQHQFLMLLLVIETDLDDLQHPLEIRRTSTSNQLEHRRIDVGAILRDLVGARPGNEAALRPRMTRSRGNVIRIEQIGEALVEDPVIMCVRLQQELLEKPGRMRAVPLDRARVRHRLHDLVLGRQWRRAALGLTAHR